MSANRALLLEVPEALPRRRPRARASEAGDAVVEGEQNSLRGFNEVPSVVRHNRARDRGSRRSLFSAKRARRTVGRTQELYVAAPEW